VPALYIAVPDVAKMIATALNRLRPIALIQSIRCQLTPRMSANVGTLTKAACPLSAPTLPFDIAIIIAKVGWIADRLLLGARPSKQMLVEGVNDKEASVGMRSQIW
jgi:hypothetical protein